MTVGYSVEIGSLSAESINGYGIYIKIFFPHFQILKVNCEFVTVILYCCLDTLDESMSTCGR